MFGDTAAHEKSYRKDWMAGRAFYEYAGDFRKRSGENLAGYQISCMTDEYGLRIRGLLS